MNVPWSLDHQAPCLPLFSSYLFVVTQNGQEVTDAVLETAWTEYKLRVPYSTYDVTSLISTKQKDADDGLNVLGRPYFNRAPAYPR